MKYEVKEASAELVIVGAGFPGICTAIQAARMGVHVALINDRGVLGGNTSCEIWISVNGASDGGPLNLNSREGGLISEILLEFRHRSPDLNRYIWDAVLMDFVAREKIIDVYLNTCIDEAAVDGTGAITRVSGTQNTTETRWNFTGAWFVDATGDGTLGALAGADFMKGREAKGEYGERFAPDEADDFVIPSTLTWTAKDMGHPVRYVAPDFALDLTKTDILKRRVIPHGTFYRFQWYYEVGGDYDHVRDREQIIADHKALTHGIWNYIKNSGEYPESENYDFEYIGCIPGTREYRRLRGDYILNQNDLERQKDFDDTVGHGGWNIDLHALYGIFDTDIINKHIFLKGIYQIPYRCGYSGNVPNLFMSGRCMSTTHAAFGSTRVIATLATLGQAVGMAAGLCKAHGTTPRGVYEQYREELQQRLLAADQLIVGLRSTDEKDLARGASAAASSTAALKLGAVRPTHRTISHKGAVNVQSQRLTKSLGLSLPVGERLETLQIFALAGEQTELTCRVYRPGRRENYGPEELLREFTVSLSASDSHQWVSLPVKADGGGYYLFVELEANEAVEVAIGGEPLPTTQMFQKDENHAPNLWDIDTLKMAEFMWHRRADCLCFRTTPEQCVYGPENVVNGYNRAYGQPNLWLSDRCDDQPRLTLTWPEPVSVSRLMITFAIDTTLRLYNEITESVMPLLAQDFTVTAGKNGEQTIAVVKDNFKKVCRLCFDPVVTDCISFRFDRSATGQVAVYEVRAYE